MILGSWQQKTLPNRVSNVNSSADTLEDVNNLGFQVFVGKMYWFRFYVPFESVISTTGTRWNITAPSASAAFMNMRTQAGTGVTHLNSTTLGSSALSTSSNSDLDANLCVAWGFIVPSADGFVELRHSSEISNSEIAALAGAFVAWKEISL